MSDKLLLDIATVGATILGGGAGFRFVVSGLKLFIKDVLPLMKQQSKPVETKESHCMYHDSMGEVVKEFKSMCVVLVRIETKLEGFVALYSEHAKLLDEIFNRLRNAETSIAVLEEHNK